MVLTRYTMHQYNVIVDVLGDWSRTTFVAGENDKRCATKHAEISSVKYVEYCKDVYDYNVNSKSTAFSSFFFLEGILERLNIIRT